jgi:predicted TPR repeat methyltransferase
MRRFYRLGAILIITFFVACTLQEARLGEELEKKGDWDGAVAAYRDAIKKEPFDKELEKKFRHAKVRAAEQHFAQGANGLKNTRLLRLCKNFKWP